MKLILKAGIEPKIGDILILRKRGMEFGHNNSFRPYAIMSNNSNAIKFNGVDICSMLIGKKYRVKEVSETMIPNPLSNPLKLTFIIIE